MSEKLSNGQRTAITPEAKLCQGIVANTDLAKCGAGLSRGPNMTAKNPNAVWTQTWPVPGATLDLDFANDRGYVRGVGNGKSMDAVTFTRASNATYVGSDGLLKQYSNQGALGVNLLTFPQDFDNAAWTKLSSATVNANTIIAPDGTLSADTITDSSAATYQGVQQLWASVSGSNYTGSVYIKKTTGVLSYYPLFQVAKNQTTSWCGVIVDTTNGTLSVLSGGAYSAPVSSSIVDSGDYWRVIITAAATFTGSTNGFEFYPAASTNGTAISATATGSNVFWGAQLELGSSATTYYPTNINTPRFDWASTTQLPQNLLNNSQDFTNAAWTKQTTTVTANANTAPDNTNTGTKLIPTITSSGQRCVFQSIGTKASTSYTFSCYAKIGEYSGLYIRDGYTGFYNVFNLSAGTVTASSSSIGSIVSVGSGWYRCSSVMVASGSNARIDVGVLQDGTQTPATVYTGDGTSGIYIWGSQLELGSSASTYEAQGAFLAANTPLQANTTCNGLLIEESRTNRALWCRDATSGTGTNMLTYSEQFDNAAWTSGKSAGASVTANTAIAPDGTTTADTVTFAASSDYLYNSVSNYPAVIGQSVVFSLYCKTTTQLIVFGGASPSGTDVFSYVAVGGGWYKQILIRTFTVTTSASPVQTLPYGLIAGAGSYVIWGAQLTPLPFTTDYQVTTTTALYGWSKSNVTVAKNKTGIDGVANAATSITASSANGILIQPVALASGSRTNSVYLKRITGTGTVQVSLDGSTWSSVDLSNGLWNRIVLSGTVTNPVVGIKIVTSGDAVAMDFAQIEDGLFATTPILTTSATVTRSQDVANVSTSVFSGLGLASAGTLYAAGRTPPFTSNTANAPYIGAIAISGTASYGVGYGFANNNGNNSLSYSYNYTSNVPSAGNNANVYSACVYNNISSNSGKGALNGKVYFPNVTQPIGQQYFNTIFIGGLNADSRYFWNSTISRIWATPAKLSEAGLTDATGQAT